MANPNPVLPPNWAGNKPREQLVEAGRKGGQAYARNVKERKRTKEVLEIFLSLPLKQRKNADIEEIKAFEQLKGKNITVNEAIQLKQIQRALNGDLSSAQYIRDSVGDKPVDKVEAKVEQTNPLEGLTTDELRELIKSDK